MDALRKAGDSCGARIEVRGQRRAAGLGEPLYDRLDADIAYAMMGLNAVKGVEIGDGFGVVAQRGSEHGDELTPEGFASNHAGGVLGGISTGQDLVVRIAIKPTSSIRTPQGVDRPRRRAHHGGDLRPPRPLRGHPRHAHRRGAAGPGADGPRAAPPRAVR
jgi:chorismate synthase